MENVQVTIDPSRPEHLSLAFRDLNEVPEEIVLKFAPTVKELDLSHNLLTDLRSLHGFENLTTLILDNNELKSHVKFPPMPNLEMLWLNHNKVTNLSILVDAVAKSFPKLKYFSLMNNQAAPSYFNGGSYQQYQDYRYYVLSNIPEMITIDDIMVTYEEREEATRIYGKRRVPAADRKKKDEKRNLRVWVKKQRERMMLIAESQIRIYYMIENYYVKQLGWSDSNSVNKNLLIGICQGELESLK